MAVLCRFHNSYPWPIVYGRGLVSTLTGRMKIAEWTNEAKAERERLAGAREPLFVDGVAGRLQNPRPCPATIWKWVLFNAFVLGMLALDLCVFHRRPREMKLKEALVWSADVDRAGVGLQCRYLLFTRARIRRWSF